MLVGEQYKRAAWNGSRASAAAGDSEAVATAALRIAWALSRVPALPVPDLAERLAGAIAHLCGVDGAVLLQIGRLAEPGGWVCESVGWAGRACRITNVATKPGGIPWPSVPRLGGASVFLVSEPDPDQACWRWAAERFASVNLGVALAGLACTRRVGALTLTVQFGCSDADREGGGTAARAALLRQTLPWMHAIAHAALGLGDDGPGRAWLTDRELLVLEKLVEGRSVSEIAESLGRSRFTVHDQVKSLHRKLGVHTRAALVGCATIGVPPPSFGCE